MRINLENIAHEHRVSQAVVIRHAIAEYMEKRGKNAFIAHEKGGSHPAPENLLVTVNFTDGRLSTDNSRIQSITEAAARDSLVCQLITSVKNQLLIIEENCQQRFLMNHTVEQLIDQFPDCPQWASLRVDRLLVIKEEQGLD